MKKQQLTVRIDVDDIKEMENLVTQKKFDSKPSIIRRAVHDFLENRKRTIYS